MLSLDSPSVVNMVRKMGLLPAPSNLSVAWNFGSLAGFCLILQILTGVFLAMHYSPDVDLAFNSCVHISRDVWFGWLIRAVHSNGASFFFLLVYLHIGRGVYYGSYRFVGTWVTGVFMLFILMATAFVGYVLVWGQMSFWAATVITNLLSALPKGTAIVEWIWGGFAVGNPTLHRFFIFHFILPFVLVIMSITHLAFLHGSGSSNPLGISAFWVPFHPYYTWKDLVGVCILVGAILWVSLLSPGLFMEGENYIVANPLVTPAHIKPEWYFLWAYAILRAVPNKLGGVLALVMAVGVLLLLPLGGGGCQWSVVRQALFWSLVVVVILLSWLGSCPAQAIYLEYSRVLTVMYFLGIVLLGIC